METTNIQKLKRVLDEAVELSSKIDTNIEQDKYYTITKWLDMFQFEYPSELIEYAVIGFCIKNLRKNHTSIFRLKICNADTKWEKEEEISTTHLLDKMVLKWNKRAALFENRDGKFQNIDDFYWGIRNNDDFLSVFVSRSIKKETDNLIRYLCVHGLRLYCQAEGLYP